MIFIPSKLRGQSIWKTSSGVRPLHCTAARAIRALPHLCEQGCRGRLNADWSFISPIKLFLFHFLPTYPYCWREGKKWKWLQKPDWQIKRRGLPPGFLSSCCTVAKSSLMYQQLTSWRQATDSMAPREGGQQILQYHGLLRENCVSQDGF